MEASVGRPHSPTHHPCKWQSHLISMAEETQGDEVENPFNPEPGNLNIAQSRAPLKVPKMWLTFFPAMSELLATKSLRFCVKNMPEIRRGFEAGAECPIHPLSKASPTFLKYSTY